MEPKFTTLDYKLERLDKASSDGLRYGMAIVNTELSAGGRDIIRFNWRKNMNYDRFDANPVLLANHDERIESVIGIVASRQATRDGLEVGMKFDEADPYAQRIAAKWDAGYVRGLSLGLLLNDADMGYDESEDRFILQVNSADLAHLAIVATPRDPNSLKNSITEFKDELRLQREREQEQIAAARRIIAEW